MKKINVYTLTAGRSFNSTLKERLFLSTDLSENFYVTQKDEELILEFLKLKNNLLLKHKNKIFNISSDQGYNICECKNINNKEIDFIIEKIHLIDPNYSYIENKYDTIEWYCNIYKYIEENLRKSCNDLLFLGFLFEENTIPEWHNIDDKYQFIKLRKDLINNINDFIFECSHEVTHMVLYKKGRVNTYFEEGLAVYISFKILCDLKKMTEIESNNAMKIFADGLDEKYKIAFTNVRKILSYISLKELIELFDDLLLNKKNNINITKYYNGNKICKKINIENLKALYENFDE